MGYTHYWYRKESLDRVKFAAWSADVRKLFRLSADIGIHLAGGDGQCDPVATDDIVLFNGSENCGHVGTPDLTIPWPGEGAQGIASDGDVAVAGKWFAGHTLSARQCNGDCSYEGFLVELYMERPSWEDPEPGLVSSGCKTAYRPYDVTITAALIAIKHHFGDDVRVSTDGKDANWDDGRMLVTTACGLWGVEYGLEGDYLERTADAKDVAIALERLAEIDRDPTLLVRGEELDRRLRKLEE